MPSANDNPQDREDECLGRAQDALDKGDVETAEKALREALSVNPRNAEAADTLGDLLFRQGRLDEAEACFRNNAALHPDSARAHSNLGAALLARAGKTEDAVACFERATRIDPGFARGHRNLGCALWMLRKPTEAISAFQKALSMEPECVETLNALGVVYEGCLCFREAKSCYEKALKIDPDYHFAWNSLAKVFREQGFIDEAIDCYRKAVRAKPDSAGIHSNLLYTLHYQRVLEPEMLFREHKEWARCHAPAHLARTQHDNVPDPDRPLRVGYLTPDIRTHSVAHFLEPILDAHDPGLVQPYAYSQVEKPDDVTARMSSKFVGYRSTVGQSDGEVAETILRDRIDILVDLAGHTAGNRLTVMARRPAPVQVTYLGYPDTTGMSAVDYRLTDALADPEGNDVLYTERLVRLPESFLCFRLPEESPAVVGPPALSSGRITFGSFNSLFKVNEDVIRTWAALLNRVPGSRLMLKSAAFQNPTMRDRFLGFFDRQRIQRERVVLASWEPGKSDHLGLYGEIDIGLDPFPYHGTTTTCEALWMGVPVVSRRGAVHASRVGCSLLHQVDLDDLVARDEEEYIGIAAALAADPKRLAELRSEMRGRMLRSPLCDKVVFTRNLEKAYRAIWHTWSLAHGGRFQSAIRDTMGADDSEKEANTQYAIDAPSESGVANNIQAAVGTQRPVPKEDTVRPDVAVQEALLADELDQAGWRARAFGHALAGWRYVRDGRFTKGAPAALLQAWQSPSVAGVVLRQCISLGSASSYLNRGHCKEWFMAWAKLEPENPEPFLRLGLLCALEAVLAKSPIPSPALEALSRAAQWMRDERSAMALALCSRPPAELRLPYDGAHLFVNPDLRDLVTYVLLEQGDWYEEDIDLFRTLVKPGMKVLDLGSHVGMYSLSAAQRVGTEGQVISVEPAGDARGLLSRTAMPFPCWAIHGDMERICASTGHLVHGVGAMVFDLIRLDIRHLDAATLSGLERWFRTGSPVVFYPVKKDRKVNDGLVRFFGEMGYRSYIYLSRKKTLAPLDASGEVDAMVLNAIAARPERAAQVSRELGCGSTAGIIP